MSDTIKFERGIGFYIEEDNSEECFDDEDFMEEYYDNMPQEEK